MPEILINPTTCSNVDRLLAFLTASVSFAQGSPAIMAHGQSLRLRLVRIGEGESIRYEIQVVE